MIVSRIVSRALSSALSEGLLAPRALCRARAQRETISSSLKDISSWAKRKSVTSVERYPLNDSFNDSFGESTTSVVPLNGGPGGIKWPIGMSERNYP